MTNLLELQPVHPGFSKLETGKFTLDWETLEVPGLANYHGVSIALKEAPYIKAFLLLEYDHLVGNMVVLGNIGDIGTLFGEDVLELQTRVDAKVAEVRINQFKNSRTISKILERTITFRYADQSENERGYYNMEQVVVPCLEKEHLFDIAGIAKELTRIWHCVANSIMINGCVYDDSRVLLVEVTEGDKDEEE